MGLDQRRTFHRYHRVLSCAKWSSMEASGLQCLRHSSKAFVAEGPLVVGVDESLEHRQGKKIAAKGIYRDPVRSSHTHFVKTSALRWICVVLLAEVPWASRVWALPFASALAYSERYAAEQGKRHKSLTEWAWQMLLLVRRWYPKRQIVAVADGGYASLSYSIAAGISRTLSPSSLALGSTPPSTSRLRPASRDRWVGLVSRALGFRTSRR